MEKEFRVLSIQSHVVSGYCGNKSAVFPLQVLGIEVDFINSVQFSNHTGYPLFKGQILNSDELQELFDGLKKNKLHNYSHVLTGYIGSVSFLSKVADIVKELKSSNSSLVYVCDPVIGDNGSLYVPKELIPIYKEVFLPLANVMTPNQFEIELLSDVKVTDESSALEAVNVLHSKGVSTVLLTSCSFASNPKELSIYGSSETESGRSVLKINVPVIKSDFTGSGDLFASCALAWMAKTNNLKDTLEKTVATVQSVLQNTYKYAQGITRENPNVPPELRLIQNKQFIENPQVEIRASKIL